MTEHDSKIVDWVNLPEGATSLALWAALHDVQIVSIRSSFSSAPSRSISKAITCWNFTNFLSTCNFF